MPNKISKLIVHSFCGSRLAYIYIYVICIYYKFLRLQSPGSYEEETISQYLRPSSISVRVRVCVCALVCVMCVSVRLRARSVPPTLRKLFLRQVMNCSQLFFHTGRHLNLDAPYPIRLRSIDESVANILEKRFFFEFE